MAQAKRDQNSVPVILGLSNADGLTPLSPYVDSATNRLLVSDANAGGAAGTTVVIESFSTVGTKTGSVTVAGTRVQLATQAIKRTIITCNEGNGTLANGGAITIGDSAVVGTTALRRGLTLFPTQSAEFKVNNLNLLYVDAVDSTAQFEIYWEA